MWLFRRERTTNAQRSFFKYFNDAKPVAICNFSNRCSFSSEMKKKSGQLVRVCELYLSVVAQFSAERHNAVTTRLSVQ